MEVFGYILNLIIAAIGLFAIMRGVLPFSRSRQLSGTMARVVGLLFVVAAIMGFYPELLWVSSLMLIAGLVIGWTTGKPPAPPDDRGRI
jgi:hypothetical protein